MQLFQPKKMDAAARAGDLEEVKRLCELAVSEGREPDWSAETCVAASTGGHLRVLEYLRSGEAGLRCPWNAKTYVAAITNGHLEIVDFLYFPSKCGLCPTGDYEFNKARALAVEHGHDHIVKYFDKVRRMRVRAQDMEDYERLVAMGIDARPRDLPISHAMDGISSYGEDLEKEKEWLAFLTAGLKE